MKRIISRLQADGGDNELKVTVDTAILVSADRITRGARATSAVSIHVSIILSPLSFLATLHLLPEEFRPTVIL